MASIPTPPRTLKLHMRGRDVSALQRALWRAGYRHVAKGDPVETGVFGSYLQGQLKQFQVDNRIDATGWYGVNSFKKLYPFYDARARSLIKKVIQDNEKPPEEIKILRVVQAMELAYRNRHNIHYTQGGFRWVGIYSKLYPPKYPAWADCSSLTTWAYWTEYGHGPDFINGQNWLAGYTGTQIAHGSWVSYKIARPGDLVFYGRTFTNIKHVTMYVGNGMCISHGSESGPLYLPVDYRGDRQQVRTYVR